MNEKQVISELEDLQKSICDAQNSIRPYVRLSASIVPIDPQSAQLAGLLNGGWVINEPALQNSPFSLGLAISKVLNPPTESYVQTAKDLVLGVAESFQKNAASFEAQIETSGLKALKQKLFTAFSAKSPRNLKAKAEQYKQFAKRAQDIAAQM